MVVHTCNLVLGTERRRDEEFKVILVFIVSLNTGDPASRRRGRRERRRGEEGRRGGRGGGKEGKRGGEEKVREGRAIAKSLPHHVCQHSALCPLPAVTLRRLLPFCN